MTYAIIVIIVINLKYQMHNYKGMLRQISKIYPPQLSQNQGKIVIYNPLEQWVQTHSVNSLQDLIEIQACVQPLFLNDCKNEILLQSEHQIFLEDSTNEWIKTVKKRLVSEKKIESETLKISESYLNINESGNMNIWKIAQEQTIEDASYNPESLKNIFDKEQNGPQEINTSINAERLVKEYRHGYSFSSILYYNQCIYSLHQFESDETNSFRKILKTDISGRQGDSSFYNCSLPQKVRKIIAFDRNVCAFGGKDALIIDNRTQNIVCNINSVEQNEINSITKIENTNLLYLARNNQILIFDPRKQRELIASDLKFEQNIDTLELFKEKQKTYCCVSFKLGNKITLAEL